VLTASPVLTAAVPRLWLCQARLQFVIVDIYPPFSAGGGPQSAERP